MSLDFTDGMPILARVMVWCFHAKVIAQAMMVQIYVAKWHHLINSFPVLFPLYSAVTCDTYIPNPRPSMFSSW